MKRDHEAGTMRRAKPGYVAMRAIVKTPIKRVIQAHAKRLGVEPGALMDELVAKLGEEIEVLKQTPTPPDLDLNDEEEWNGFVLAVAVERYLIRRWIQ